MNNADDFQHLYERAQQAVHDQDAERARVLLRAAVELSQEAAQKKRALLALAKLEKTPQAKAAAYQRVLELDPRDAVARAYLRGLRDAEARPAQTERKPARRSALWLTLPTLLLALLGFGLFNLMSGTPTLDLPTQAPSLTPSQSISQAGSSVPQLQAQAQLPPQAKTTRVPSIDADELATATSQTAEDSPGSRTLTNPTPLPSATLALFVLPTETPLNNLSPGGNPAPFMPTNATFILPTNSPAATPTTASFVLPTNPPPPTPTTASLVLPTNPPAATPTTASLILPSATPTSDDFVPLPTPTSIPLLIAPTFALPPTEAPPSTEPSLPDFPVDPLSGGSSSNRP